MQSDNFESLWTTADKSLSGPEVSESQRTARILLWKKEEWHDWFRWYLTLRGTDWSKPIWFGTLAIGLVALVLVGLGWQRWEITAGGIVAWFTIVNLGFFSYLGLRTPHPPKPVAGPFPDGLTVRARMAIYPATYNGRKLARLCYFISKFNESDAENEVWSVIISLPKGLSEELRPLIKLQETFRMQQADAPAMMAVCESVSVTREAIDGGAHPLKLLAWKWMEAESVPFEKFRDNTQVE